MRVLMTSDAVGGVWRYTRDLAQGFSERGHDVTIAILGPALSRSQIRGLVGFRVVPLNHPLDWTAASGSEVHAASDTLRRLAVAIEADVMHLHAPAFAAGVAFPVPVVAVCHSCVATWWAACGAGPLPADLAWRRDLAGEGCRRVEALLAPTGTFAADTARAYGLSRLPIVIRNGCDGRPNNRASGTTSPVVFTAGRLWDRAKNMAALDSVAALLSTPALAAGSIEGPNGERAVFTHLQVLGHLDEGAMAGVLDQRPIFVSLARYEPFGLAVLEAAQAGCPLVLSDIPTFRELWNGAALFVDPDNPEETAAAIQGLIVSPQANRALGVLAQERAAAYGAKPMIEGVLAVFHSLVAAHPPVKAFAGGVA